MSIRNPEQTMNQQVVNYPINYDSAPLWHIVNGNHVTLSINHPRRTLQEPDSATADYLFSQFGEMGPRPTTVHELWEKCEIKKPFTPIKWREITKYFGTDEMYTNPEHKKSIHGNGHQDRVTVYAHLLGQYKKLNESDMKVLMVAASVHDRARINDMTDSDHGLRSAMNVDNGKNYITTYEERGMKFTPAEIEAIKVLCIYHEKPWSVVPDRYKNNKRMRTLIQTIHAADAADRYRSPNPYPEIGWWPNPKFFLNFFDNDSEKVADFLDFAAYFTLSSEKDRFDFDISVEEAIRRKSVEMGIVAPDKYYGRHQTRRSRFFFF